jgi:cytochrome c-type biogenesis protein CcmH
VDPRCGSEGDVRRLLALLAVVLLAAPGAAMAATPRTSLADLEDEVMCVTCRVPLAIADSPEADRERAFIKTQIARGKTKNEVKDALVGQYGARVLATPRDEGVDLAAWLVPGLALLAALAGLLLLLRAARRRPEPAAPAASAPALSSADARRLDDDLARFDG